jgi:DNA-directed RNA polymerase subunit RPC12/RpoP
MTGEPGDECPHCGRRLSSAICTCGWRVSSSSSSAACVDCSARVALQLDDDDVLRCAACHVTYLRVRATLDPISVEELEQCRARIGAALARIASRAAPPSTSIAVSDSPGVDPGGSHPENSTS